MKKKNNAGFTLIEIVIAIVILSSALVTFFGLQAAALNNARRNNHLLHSVSITRTIFSLIEARPTVIENMDREGTVQEIINDIATKAPVTDGGLFEPYRVRLTVSYWPFPELDPEALKRIALTVSWGSTESESLTTNFFISGKEVLDDNL